MIRCKARLWSLLKNANVIISRLHVQSKHDVLFCLFVLGVSISTIWRRRVNFNMERRRHRGRRLLTITELREVVRGIKERSMDAGIIMIEGELASQNLFASRSAISEALISLDTIGANLRWHEFTPRVSYNVPSKYELLSLRACTSCLTLETSAFELPYGGQFTLSTQLINPIILYYPPPTQHHSIFRNLPPLFICN